MLVMTVHDISTSPFSSSCPAKRYSRRYRVALDASSALGSRQTGFRLHQLAKSDSKNSHIHPFQADFQHAKLCRSSRRMSYRSGNCNRPLTMLGLSGAGKDAMGCWCLPSSTTRIAFATCIMDILRLPGTNEFNASATLRMNHRIILGQGNTSWVIQDSPQVVAVS